MSAWTNWKRTVVLAALFGTVVIAIVTVVAVVDEYARSQVRARVQAEYFAQLRRAVADAVGKELQRNGCDDRAGVAAAMQFLAKERRHIALQVYEPDWGWEVEGYRFTIRWRSTWIASFQVNRRHQVTNIRTNKTFEGELKEVVCPPACGGALCWLNDLLSLRGPAGSTVS